MTSGGVGPPAPRSSSVAPPVRTTRISSGSYRASRESDRASVLPFVLAIASLLVGLVAALVITATATSSLMAWGIVGYVAAGFLPPLFLGWDSTAQRKGLKNPNFLLRRDYSRLLRFIVFAGLAVAIFHIWTVADVLAVAVSEVLYVWGVLTP